MPDIDAPDFGHWVDRFADAPIVLLGEATHGTSELYRARAEITKRLITEHGFTIVAVEADWPDASRIDRYIRGCADGASGAMAFARFPTWMWRNVEVRAFVDWLHAYNGGIVDSARRVASMASTSTACMPLIAACWTISTSTIPKLHARPASATVA